MVKDTTLINIIREQGERYLFTLNNSRILNDQNLQSLGSFFCTNMEIFTKGKIGNIDYNISESECYV